MLPSRLRDRPHMAWARWLSLRLESSRSEPSCFTSISSATVQASWPLGPFTVTVWPSSVTVTPLGMAIGFFPIRDISVDPAENFAAHVGVTRRGVRHDALGRRQDRDPEAVLHRLQVLDRRIDATAGLRDAGDVDDDGGAIEVLQLNLEFREGAGLFYQVVAADVAFVGEHVEETGAHLGRGRHHLRAAALGGVLDAGDQIADGIVDHLRPPLPARLDEAGDQPVRTEF